MIAFLVLFLVAFAAGQTTPALPDEELQFIGNLRGSEHSINGMVYAKGDMKLIIKGFEYDGKGEDAFFWVGISGDQPSANGQILPYPYSGIFYQPDETDAPILFGEFNGTTDIILLLPAELRVTELKWFSVWNRREKKSYGELIFPPNFSLNKKPSVNVQQEEQPSTDLPSPLVPHNAHDPSRSTWEEPKAEPESVPEVTADDNDHHTNHHDFSKPLRSSAFSIIPNVIATILTAAVLL